MELIAALDVTLLPFKEALSQGCFDTLVKVQHTATYCNTLQHTLISYLALLPFKEALLPFKETLSRGCFDTCVKV